MSNDFPMYLTDDYEGGSVEERAWVEVTTDKTATEATAIEWLTNEMPPFDEEMRYEVTGQSYQRPSGFEVEGSGGELRTVKPLSEYGPCQYPGCEEGHVEVLKELTWEGDLHRDWFARQVGRELTPERRKEITVRGGRITETTREDCDECYGTGKAGEFIFDSCEPLPWEACEADHPEAVHFWDLTVTDEPEEDGPPVVSDEQERMDI